MSAYNPLDSFIPIRAELKSALSHGRLDPRKDGYLKIVGILGSEGDPPPFTDIEYKKNSFLRFFDRFTETTFFPESGYEMNTEGADKKNTTFDYELQNVVKLLEDQVDGLRTHLDQNKGKLVHFLRDSGDEELYEQLNTLALEIFGGYIEYLVLLLTASQDQKDVRDFVKKRYSKIPKSHKSYPSTDTKKSALIQAYNRLSVAPVYVRGACKIDDDTYFILQLCPKQPFGPDGGVSAESLRHLHTTFCIKQEEDHPADLGNVIGSHQQIRLQGGMRQLAKESGTANSDAIPILLENSRLLSSNEKQRWRP